MKRKTWLIALLLAALALSLTALTACGTEEEPAVPLPTAAPTPEKPDETESLYDWQAMAALTAIKEKYSGYWYGVFHLYNGTGEYVSYDDDAVAFFDFESGLGNGAMAHVTVYGVSDQRLLADFMAQFEADESWTVDGAEIFGSFAGDVSHEFFEGAESMLILSGEAESDDSAFSFSINIRPWGMTWDDVVDEYPDEMPAYYDDWYLPQIDSSIDSPDE